MTSFRDNVLAAVRRHGVDGTDAEILGRSVRDLCREIAMRDFDHDASGFTEKVMAHIESDEQKNARAEILVNIEAATVKLENDVNADEAVIMLLNAMREYLNAELALKQH